MYLVVRKMDSRRGGVNKTSRRTARGGKSEKSKVGTYLSQILSYLHFRDAKGTYGKSVLASASSRTAKKDWKLQQA